MKRLDELGVYPAPWDTLYVHKPAVYDRDGRCVADCELHFDRKRDDADARLIAAAPDLYEALRVCMRQMCEYCRREAAHSSPGAVCDDGCAVMLAAKAALEKAGGAE